MELIREVAKIVNTHLGVEDHGILTAMLQLDFGGSGIAAGGWALDDRPAEPGGDRVPSTECGRWVAGVVRACGVEYREQVKGRTVFALMERPRGMVVGIEPLPTERGSRFMFAATNVDEEVPA